MRVLPWAGMVAAVWALVPAPRAAADEPDAAALYQRCVRSTVFIASASKDGDRTGIGTLIDAKRRLVLTSADVVSRDGPVTCQFPIPAEGGVVVEQRKYMDRIAAGKALKGKITHRDESRNLALIELDTLPPDTRALPLAKASPRLGEWAMNIGNPGKVDSVFSTTRGEVRGVRVAEFVVGGGSRRVKARMITLTSPLSVGTPGALWINGAGHLMGLEQVGGAQDINRLIDVTEVRAFLTENKVDLPAPRADLAPKK